MTTNTINSFNLNIPGAGALLQGVPTPTMTIPPRGVRQAPFVYILLTEDVGVYGYGSSADEAKRDAYERWDGIVW